MRNPIQRIRGWCLGRLEQKARHLQEELKDMYRSYNRLYEMEGRHKRGNSLHEMLQVGHTRRQLGDEITVLYERLGRIRRKINRLKK